MIELLGFISGVAAMGAAWMLLWLHDHWKVMSNFRDSGARRARPGNALIWPGR